MSAKKAPPPKVDPPAVDPPADVTELPALKHDGSRFMLTLSRAATKLLDTACLVEEKDRSAIIEDLITTDLSGYHAGKTTAVVPGEPV